MNHKRMKAIALILAATAALSLAACSGEKTPSGTSADDQETAAITEEKKTPSASIKVESDYDVETVEAVKVPFGSTLQDVIALLPTELSVMVPAEGAGESEELFTEKFETLESFNANWTLCDADKVTQIGDGKFASIAASTRLKAFISEPEWAKADTEEYANYAIKMVVRGTEEVPSNNFGIIFRASDVTESGADSYEGMYVGIGDSNGQLCVGYAHNNWNSVTTVDFDYQPNVDYKLEVLVYNESFIVKLDDVVLYQGDTQGFVNGTVGIRTYNQLFEVSEFSVRTLGAEDYEEFGGYVESKTYPVEWSCTDYDGSKAGKYGFVGTIQGLETGNAAVKVIVTVQKEG